MEEAGTGFNAFLSMRGVAPADCFLYRHSGTTLAEARQRWSEGPERFLSFTTYQDRDRAERLATRRFVAHFIAENFEGGDHRGKFLGVTEVDGAPGPFDDGEIDIVPGYMKGEAFPPREGGKRFALGMRWFEPEKFEPYAGRLWIDWGKAPIVVVQRADINPKAILGAGAELGGPGRDPTGDPEGFHETARLKTHISYERRCLPAGVVKAQRGLICEGCELDALAEFGPDLAMRVIEAHHRTPRAEINEHGRRVTANDFFVLCATCHRLIHGLGTLDDLSDLKRLLRRRP